MLGYLSMDFICSLKLKVFVERRPWKTIPFSEQITHHITFISPRIYKSS